MNNVINDKDEEMPLLASGKIVKDYRPLVSYYKLLKLSGNRSFIENRYFDLVTELLEKEKNYMNIDNLIKKLENEIEKDVDEKLAAKAFKECCMTEIGPQYARKMLARLIAGYVIEMLDSLGKINIKMSQ